MLVCIALVLIWFRDGYIFAGGESGIPYYDLDRTYMLASQAWKSGQGGVPVVESIAKIPYYFSLKVLYGFGFSGVFLQAATFFILMAVGAVSVYFLLKEIFRNDKTNLIAFSGALFYLLNPYTMMQVWGRGLVTQHFPFALLPLFLLFYVLCLKYRKIVFACAALVSSFVLSSAFTNLTFFVSLWFVVGVYFFYFILTKRNRSDKRYAVFATLVLAGGFLLTHFWWMYHNYHSLTSLVANRSSSLEHNLGTLRGVSRETPFGSVIRLLHNFLTKDRNYGDIYFNPIFVVLSYLPPVAFLFSIKTINKSKYFVFLVSIFLLSLFVVLGSNAPLGFLFEFLFVNFPFLQAFRNPYEKMGTVFILAYSPFFAVGLYSFSKWISERLKSSFWSASKIVYLLLLLYCGFYVWPLWTGHFAGGFNFNPWIKVPTYYEEANMWLNQREGDFKIFHLPINPGDGLRYNWEEPYQGTDPSEFLFDRPSISKNVLFNKEYYNVLLQRFGVFQENAYGPDPDISNSEFRSGTLSEELSKLNVSYIVFHNDYDMSVGSFQDPDEARKYIEDDEDISKVKSFGKLDIYEVKREEGASSVYSPNAIVSAQETKPTEYIINISSENTKFDLYFPEHYSEKWQLFAGQDPVGRQYQVYSFANAWEVNGDYDELRLVYTPQEGVDRGIAISLASVLVLSVALFLNVARRVHGEQL
jgi:hypothetical protein